MAKTKTAPNYKTAQRPTSKTADKAQFERFVETARRIGVDEDSEALDRAFDKIAPQQKPERK
jgi:hypothetical protein